MVKNIYIKQLFIQEIKSINVNVNVFYVNMLCWLPNVLFCQLNLQNSLSEAIYIFIEKMYI